MPSLQFRQQPTKENMVFEPFRFLRFLQTFRNAIFLALPLPLPLSLLLLAPFIVMIMSTTILCPFAKLTIKTPRKFRALT